MAQRPTASEKPDHHDNNADRNKYVSGDGLVSIVRRFVEELTESRVWVAEINALRVDPNPYSKDDNGTAQQLQHIITNIYAYLFI